MSKRLLLLCLMSVLFVLLVAPVTSAAAQPGTWWIDSAGLNYTYTHNIFTGIANLSVQKQTSPTGERSTLTIESLYCTGFSGDVSHPRAVKEDIAPITLTVPGDPDSFEVARDLGWAGLDTTVYAYNRVTHRFERVEIHIDWFATGLVTQHYGGYERPAHVIAEIIMPECTLQIQRENFIRSTRRPRPYYG